MTFEQLIAHASVGVSRKPPEPVADGPLAETMPDMTQAGPERQLLAMVAAVAQYESCGVQPASEPAELPTPADDDARPMCSPLALALLESILSRTWQEKEPLLREWCTAAEKVGQRPPFELLPALLDAAIARTALRGLISTIGGPRATWLAHQNPRWQTSESHDTPSDSGNIDDTWQTGSRPERMTLLRGLRQSDPARAVALIESTWSADNAAERAGFVEVLAEGLSDADERFLEAALDDRSKQVRASASGLLARLPASAFVRRMIERVDPLLTLTAGGKGGLLRKSKPPLLEATLPPDTFDPAWERDGICEKPTQRMGRRVWWLRQMLAAVPLNHWRERFDLMPEQLIAACGGEFGGDVLEAWHVAAGHMPDAAWINALLRSAAAGRGSMSLSLLRHLPPDAQRTLLREFLADKDETRALEAANAVAEQGVSLDEPTARALVARLDRRVRKIDRYDPGLASLLGRLPFSIPTALYDEIASQWTGDAWEQNRSARDPFLDNLKTRAYIARAF